MRIIVAAIVLLAAVGSAEHTDMTEGTRALQTSSQCLAQERLYDYTGNDISDRLTTVDGCCSACAATPTCNAYTWTKYLGGSCYLKTKKTTSVFKGTDSDGSAYFISGLVYKCQPVQTNRDLAGIDLKNVTASQPEGCCAECRQTTGCTGFAWNSYNGGTCYLKTGPVLRVATTNVYSAVL